MARKQTSQFPTGHEIALFAQKTAAKESIAKLGIPDEFLALANEIAMVSQKLLALENKFDKATQKARMIASKDNLEATRYLNDLRRKKRVEKENKIFERKYVKALPKEDKIFYKSHGMTADEMLRRMKIEFEQFAAKMTKEIKEG